MSKQPLTKKRYVIIITLSIAIFLLAFGVMALGAILQENGIENKICYSLLAAAGIMLVGDLVFMIVNFRGMMEYEIEVKSKKLEEVKHETVKGVTQAKIKTACLREGFKNKDSLYYYKRKFIFLKDFISYFVKGVECENLISALDKELEAFGAKGYKNINKCLMLFLFKENVTEEELKYLSDVSRSLILAETSMNMPQFDTAVIVAVDTAKDEGYFVPCKSRFAVYTYGVRMLNTLLS